MKHHEKLAESATRVSRLKEVYARHHITKELWLDKTGYSIDQWYRWHNPNSGSSSTVDQWIRVLRLFHISANYIAFGIGPDLLEGGP